MLHRVFTVYDAKAEAFLQPFYAKTKGLAVRAFAQAANSGDHDFNKYATDYALFEIGEFDDSTGVIVMHDHFEPLGQAIQFVENV